MDNDIVPVTSVREGALSALANAEELLRGASLLLERKFVSTYDLIILALEEIGKAVLLWKNSDNYRKEIKIKRDDWFFDHSPKLEAAFWFHRKGRDLKSLGINVNLQDFLERIKCEREESIYVDWDAEVGKWIKPQEWFIDHSRSAYYPRSFDSIRSLLDLAGHILFYAKINLSP